MSHRTKTAQKRSLVREFPEKAGHTCDAGYSVADAAKAAKVAVAMLTS